MHMSAYAHTSEPGTGEYRLVSVVTSFEESAVDVGVVVVGDVGVAVVVLGGVGVGVVVVVLGGVGVVAMVARAPRCDMPTSANFMLFRFCQPAISVSAECECVCQMSAGQVWS